MKHRIERTLLNLLSNRMARQANVVELMPKYNLHKFKSIDKDEIEAINCIWKRLSSNINYKYWEVYKGMFPFDACLVPDDIYVRNILRVLNPMRKSYCLQNKNMYPLLYHELNQPSTLINCIDGQVYDSNNDYVEKTNLFKVLKRVCKKPYVILKPSTDSCSGNGISLLDLNDIKENFFNEQISGLGSNFVIQEVLSQSETTKRFNPYSLNTFRVNTLNLNGKITVVNIMFRHGRGKSVVDNAGAGGICIGFNQDGTVVGKAIDASLNVYEATVFGQRYDSLTIEGVKAICSTAISAHHDYLPMMGHAAWDFALDENEMPVFIEVNLGWPGIMTEQLSSCRPIFNDRIEEVIEYALRNKSIMSYTDFIGHWT